MTTARAIIGDPMAELPMTTPSPHQTWWTPEQLAERWQLSIEHVRKLIRTGELRATDMALARGKRPVWRVSDAARRRFEQS